MRTLGTIGTVPLSCFINEQSLKQHDGSITGSAHCSLIPYWREQLDKTHMLATQVSELTDHFIVLTRVKKY